MTRTAYGFGLATTAEDGTILDTWYPRPTLGEPPVGEDVPADLRAGERIDALRGVSLHAIMTRVDCDAPPADVPDAYLRLHLLSHRLVLPHGINLTGIFGILANVAWTSRGPCAIASIEQVRLRCAAEGVPLAVHSVDKFPRMVDYVVPSGVRIADADRVRLGAYLAEGTTIMHEGFVNYNAGTLGTSMIEGRVSSGVVIGDGSDVGGGASIMGTLSGGGKEVVSLGRRSLLGANSGLGIPLGDDCIVEAGLYLTAGAKVLLVGQTGDDGAPVVAKARDLAGQDGLLFRRNSITGAIEAVRREGSGITLNSALHHN